MIRSYRVCLCSWLACVALGGCVSNEPWPSELNYHETQILLRWEPVATNDDMNSVLSLVHGKVRRSYQILQELVLVEIDLDFISIEKARSKLAEQGQFVRYAEHNYFVRSLDTPNDEFYSRQWNMENTGGDVGPFPGLIGADIQAEDGWDLFTGNAEFVIAVIDSGVQLDHPDLECNIWVNDGETLDGTDTDENGYRDDIRGWDFVMRDNHPDDPEGHGTHVAGIIGAIGDNGMGVAGVNWNCKLMPLRFIGSGRGLISDAIAALEYAVLKGVRVSCNSWGDDDYSQALEDAIFEAGERDHIFVTSAGNRQKNIDVEPVYPASLNLENIITVASVDHRDELAPKSNWGEVSVDIAAPGVYVLSTSNDSDYQVLSGTSMAAAHVAGVVAMLMAHRPKMTAMEVREKVLASARDVGLGSFIQTGGVVSLLEALK